MHIPSSMLNGAVCPVTMAVAAAGVGIAGYAAAKIQDKPSAAKFAAVTSLVFALQMLNYPVQNGTSGHLLGSALAVSFLGVPFAVLAMSIVLTVQCFFFADGGASALGANVLNMSLIGVGLAGLILNRASMNKNLSLGIASFVSVIVAAAACSFEVVLSGTVALGKVFPAMLSVHALIGLGEGLLTVAVVYVLNTYAQKLNVTEKSFAIGAVGLACCAALISPLASGWPDGLEWVAGKLSFAEFRGFQLPVLFPDYQVPFLADASLATIAAGIIGVALVFALTFILGKGLDKAAV